MFSIATQPRILVTSGDRDRMPTATKHPLLQPAIAFSSGIAFANTGVVDWPIGFGAAVALSFFARRINWVLLAVFFFVGASLFSLRMQDRNPADLRQLFSNEPALVTLRGALSGDPEHRILDQDARTRYRTTARVQVSAVERDGQWQPAHGEVAISTPGFLPGEYVAGASVEVMGVLEKPSGPIAPGLFDFERYLKYQRIFFSLRAEGTNDWKIVRQAEPWSNAAFYRAFTDWARRTLARGIPDDENTRLLWAMALNWRPGLTNEISQPFMRTGTLHIFAISGLHIALIAAILVNFFHYAFRLPRKWAGGLAIPLIWFYTAATGWQASAIRSTIMSSVIIFGWILCRPNNLLNSLSAAALVILVWQPEQLFQPGFQLSFILLLTFAIWPAMAPNNPWPEPTIHLGQLELDEFVRKPDISWWSRSLARIYEFTTGRDPFLPSHLRPWWRRIFDQPMAFLLGGLNLSLASLLGSLPVIVLYFNLISYSSLVANLVIVPISGLTLAASLGSWFLAWCPPLSIALNWISWATMWFMVWFCRQLESLTWSYEYVQAPSAFTLVVYYLALIALVNGWLKKRLIATTVTALVITAATLSFWHERTTTNITMLPGAGIIYVDRPWSKEDLLIDCGRERDVAGILTRYLHARGVDSLDTVVLTHGDVALVEGHGRLAQEFRVDRTVTSHARSRSPVYRQILRTLEANPTTWRKVAESDTVKSWTVLHPPRGEDYSRADDEAMVLARTIDGHRIVLLSELGSAGQDRLLHHGADLKAEVLLCGIGSDGKPPHAALLAAIGPRTIVMAGPDAKSIRAAQQLRADGHRVLTTREGGAITIEIHAGKLAIRGMKD